MKPLGRRNPGGPFLALLLLCGPLPGGGLDPQDVPPEPDQPPPKEDSQAEAQLPEKPARRRAIRGIASVYSRSSLEFPSYPDYKYESEATFVFPDRARWRIALISEDEQPSQGQSPSLKDRRARSLRFRWGAGTWLIDQGRTDSQPFKGEEEHNFLLQMELRRIAMIWPAEFDWNLEGNSGTADLPGLGSVYVELDPKSERPTRIESRDLDGTLRERLDEIVWQVDGEHPWPTRWNLVVKGKVIWHEVFQEVKFGRKFLETYFIPADRRPGRSQPSLQLDVVQQLELQKTCVWRTDISDGARKDWALALEEGRAAVARWKAELAGKEVVMDQRPCFTLNDSGRPTGIELRLKSFPETVPEAWTERPGSKALRILDSGLGEVHGASLRKLRARVPSGAVVETPYVMVQLTSGGAGITQLVLPFRPLK